jgi:hypothetical protein
MKKNVENLQIARSYFMRFVALAVLVSLFILPVKMNAQGTKTKLRRYLGFQ